MLTSIYIYIAKHFADVSMCIQRDPTLPMHWFWFWFWIISFQKWPKSPGWVLRLSHSKVFDRPSIWHFNGRIHLYSSRIATYHAGFVRRLQLGWLSGPQDPRFIPKLEGTYCQKTDCQKTVCSWSTPGKSCKSQPIDFNLIKGNLLMNLLITNDHHQLINAYLEA